MAQGSGCAHMTNLFIGLMSGTSTDGVDGVLVEFGAPQPRLLACASAPFSAALRSELLSLNSAGNNELQRAALAANALVEVYAQVVHELLASAALAAAEVSAIGAHGQTVRHAPELGYTIQLNAPARLAELCKIAVVADFRSRDIAAGGQGAPLTPAFHAAYFGTSALGQAASKAVLNLGGIANLTLLQQPLAGFDTGPANMLMDAWAQLHLGQSYDTAGAWAASGTCHPVLLHSLLAEPWLAQAAPKSTGRDLFNLAWLQRHLQALGHDTKPLPAADVQATLLQLSVQSIALTVNTHAPQLNELIACGGGALNQEFMRTLALALECRLTTSADYGLPVQTVEAYAFAWLAYANLRGIAACLPSVSGASHASVAGCLYPAS